VPSREVVLVWPAVIVGREDAGYNDGHCSFVAGAAAVPRMEEGISKRTDARGYSMKCILVIVSNRE
jgi:hypothetical protein